MGYYNDDALVPIEDRRWILFHDGSYVERVEGTPWETVSCHFVFTPDKEKAKEFAFDDLHSRLSNKTVGAEFTRGFSRGQYIRVK